jgi:hypothetical protein
LQDLQADYDTFKKGKAREIQDLKKDSQRQESKMRRLAMLNQKQKSVLQRKIQEAEDAKKRLSALKIRTAKRTAAGTGPGKVPSGSMSSLSGSMGRATSTPIAAVTATHGGAGDSGRSAHAAAGDAEPSSASGAVAADSGSVAAPVAPATGSASVPETLPDSKAMTEWIKEEIEAVSTAHYTRVVLQGTVAKRSDLSKSALEHERKIAEIDHLPEDQKVRCRRLP